MSRNRIELLQWFGLLAGPLAWAIQLVAGYFLAEAHCEAMQWNTGWSPALIVVTTVAAVVAATAELAAVTVFLQLRNVPEDAPGPPGRQLFFAVGGMVGNVLFFVAILLGGVAAVSIDGCRPA